MPQKVNLIIYRSMKFQTINPYNNEVLAEYTEQTQAEITTALDKAQAGFETWREWSFEQRAEVMRKAAEILKNNLEIYAKTISLEMGKPISEARGEVNKCTLVLEYYAENAEQFLEAKHIESKGPTYRNHYFR